MDHRRGPRYTGADATAGIWRRLARPFELTELVDAFMGIRPAVVEALGAVKLCSSPEAMALLAAMPKGPELYSPLRNPERALRRRNLVLNEMLQDGKISAEEATTRFGMGQKGERAARWADIWSAGHSVSGVADVPTVADLVERLAQQYLAARTTQPA